MASAAIQCLWFLVVLLCATVCRSQDPSVVVTHDGSGISDDIKEGEDIQLLCEVANLNGRFVEWFKGSNRIDFSDEKYEMTANATTGMYTLTIINSTRVEDTATYTCAVLNSAGAEFGTSVGRGGIFIRVLYFPDEGNPRCYGQTVIEEGVAQGFHCQSQAGEPGVVVEWRRDMGNIDDSDTASGQFGNGTLYADYTIVPTQADIGETLTCKITSVAFPDTPSCIIGPLVVQFRPSDVAITNTNYTEDNSTYMYDALSCNATAYPPDISYSWNFSVPLDSSQQMVTDDNQTLVILNITSCETIIVATCIAVNDIGVGTADFILCEPPPPPTTTEVTTLRDTTTEIVELPTTRASEITTNPTPLKTEPPMTTGANETVTGPSILTPALYAIIGCGAFIVVAFFIGVICLTVQKGSNKDDEDEDETVEKAFQTRNVRALSIAIMDEDDEQGGIAMPNLTFVAEADEKAEDDLQTNGLQKSSVENAYADSILQASADAAPPEDTKAENPTFDTQASDKNQEPGYESIEGKAVPADAATPDNNQAENSSSDNQTSDKHPKSGSENMEGKTDSASDKPEEIGGDGTDDNLHDNDHHDNDPQGNGDDGTIDDEGFENMVFATSEEGDEDNRKSLVQEALLAVQVGNSNQDSLARAGHKANQEIEI